MLCVGQAALLEAFGAKPLVVLTAEIGIHASLVATHEKLATLSDNGDHRVIDGADDLALIHDEPGAPATSDAILDVVASIRDEQPHAK